jgi:hypothetical protein
MSKVKGGGDGMMSERVEGLVRDWGVVVEDILETQSSFIAFGKRRDQSNAKGGSPV